jgi:hypothetical protein
MRDADVARRRARLGWVLPPVLALVAVGFQFAVDVPHHAMIVHADPKPEAKTTTAARTPRAKWRARGDAYTQRLRKSWSTKPIADEPREPRFAEHHEDLLRAVVRKAEAAAVPAGETGTAEITTSASCHTIRCELELCAPTEYADKVVARLPKFRVGGRSLWHELRELEVEEQDTRVCHRYIVDFAVEGADPRNLRLSR